MSLQEILSEIYKMPLVEQKTIAESVAKHIETSETEDSPDMQLQKQMFAKCIISEIKPPRVNNEFRDFTPINVTGEPISETIIRERR
jgi:hypothetical protein